MSSVPDALAKVMAIGDERRDIAHQLVNLLIGTYAPGAEPVVLEGSAAERLAALAREREADEIVVGSRGLGRFSAALGSVSHALLQQADRPVVVVPAAAADHPRTGHPHGRCNVVVGYDGSDPLVKEARYSPPRAHLRRSSASARPHSAAARRSISTSGNASSISGKRTRSS